MTRLVHARLVHAYLALTLSLICACSSADSKPTAVKRDFKLFQREVYPVLLRDCGFPACHGAKERFFRVWGPGRSRLPTDKGLPEAFDLPTGDELSASYGLALSMIDGGQPSRSLLLRKPLAVAAGGAGHLGVDAYGRDIYRTAEDSGFLAIARWVYAEPSTQPAQANP
jgi:hypothetical protein